MQKKKKKKNAFWDAGHDDTPLWLSNTPGVLRLGVVCRGKKVIKKVIKKVAERERSRREMWCSVMKGNLLHHLSSAP